MILPPSISPKATRKTPPNNCDDPVSFTGSMYAITFLLIILAITLQKDANITSISPNPREKPAELKFITPIPAIPQKRAKSLFIENLSSLKKMKKG